MLSSVIKVKGRGAVPRWVSKAHTAASRDSWALLGSMFHRDMVAKRFTEEHAREARYTKRKGEAMPRGSKQWRRSYYGRKFLTDKGGGKNQADPLVFTGRTKQLVASGIPSITVSSRGARVRYASANTLNFRHPKSRVHMRNEFTRVTEREADQLRRAWDMNYEKAMAQAKGQG